MIFLQVSLGGLVAIAYVVAVFNVGLKWRFRYYITWVLFMLLVLPPAIIAQLSQ